MLKLLDNYNNTKQVNRIKNKVKKVKNKDRGYNHNISMEIYNKEDKQAKAEAKITICGRIDVFS